MGELCLHVGPQNDHLAWDGAGVECVGDHLFRPLAWQTIPYTLSDLVGRETFENESVREKASSDVGAGMTKVEAFLKNITLQGLGN